MSGIKVSTLRKLVREELQKTSKDEHYTPKTSLRRLINEEFVRLQKEQEEKAPEIAKKLDELREELLPHMARRVEKMGGPDMPISLEKRLQIETVSHMLEIPVNELKLYFLNCVKTSNERQLVEYRLGHVYFYAV